MKRYRLLKKLEVLLAAGVAVAIVLEIAYVLSSPFEAADFGIAAPASTLSKADEPAR